MPAPTSPKKRDAILRDYRAGVHTARIAQRHGVNEATVCSLAKRAGLQRGRSWSEADIERVGKMVRSGLTATQIAPEFGVRKGAICGVIHRNGLSVSGSRQLWARAPAPIPPGRTVSTTAWRGAPPPAAPPAKRSRADTERDNAVKMRRRRVAEREERAGPDFEVVPLAPRRAPAGEPPSLRLSLFDLTSTTCRWPHGTSGVDLHFCGHKAPVEQPYCPFHQALSLRAVPPQVRSAA